MRKLSKSIVLITILTLSQTTLSQTRNCDSTKVVKLSICDMDDITTVFRDRRKFINLNIVNESIIKKDSAVIKNYKTIVKNDSITIENYKKNQLDKDSIITNQKSTIKSEKAKSQFFKTTTYISSCAAVVLLIINLLK